MKTLKNTEGLNMNMFVHRLLSVPARAWQLVKLLSDPLTRQRISLAAKEYDSSTWTILVRIVKLFLAARFHPNESLSTGLANPNKPFDDHHFHFSSEQLHGLQMSVNSPMTAMCRDKLLFHTYCHNYGLPVPQLLGVLSRYGSRSANGHALDDFEELLAFVRNILPPTFIAKPRGGNMGRGVQLSGTKAGKDGDISPELLARNLSELATREDFLLEQRLEAHPDICTLTGTDAISSVRVVSMVPYQGAPQVLSAYFRVITHDAITDNISHAEGDGYSGNILAYPNIDTGVVESAFLPKSNGVDRTLIDTHPLTGEPLRGFILPFWPEVHDLVTKAASRFLPLRVIGWDVAITPLGPVLIEANELFQYRSSGPRVPIIRSALQAERDRLVRLDKTIEY